MPDPSTSHRRRKQPTTRQGNNSSRNLSSKPQQLQPSPDSKDKGVLSFLQRKTARWSSSRRASGSSDSMHDSIPPPPPPIPQPMRSGDTLLPTTFKLASPVGKTRKTTGISAKRSTNVCATMMNTPSWLGGIDKRRYRRKPRGLPYRIFWSSVPRRLFVSFVILYLIVFHVLVPVTMWLVFGASAVIRDGADTGVAKSASNSAKNYIQSTRSPAEVLAGLAHSPRWDKLKSISTERKYLSSLHTERDALIEHGYGRYHLPARWKVLEAIAPEFFHRYDSQKGDHELSPELQEQLPKQNDDDETSDSNEEDSKDKTNGREKNPPGEAITKEKSKSDAAAAGNNKNKNQQQDEHHVDGDGKDSTKKDGDRDAAKISETKEEQLLDLPDHQYACYHKWKFRCGCEASMCNQTLCEAGGNTWTAKCFQSKGTPNGCAEKYCPYDEVAERAKQALAKAKRKTSSSSNANSKPLHASEPKSPKSISAPVPKTKSTKSTKSKGETKEIKTKEKNDVAAAGDSEKLSSDAAASAADAKIEKRSDEERKLVDTWIAASNYNTTKKSYHYVIDPKEPRFLVVNAAYDNGDKPIKDEDHNHNSLYDKFTDKENAKFLSKFRTLDNMDQVAFERSRCGTQGPTTIGTTLVIQTSIERMWIIEETCSRRWTSSPVIAVVLIPWQWYLFAERENMEQSLLDHCPHLTLVRYRTGNFGAMTGHYPVNRLRNVGLDLVTTSHVMMMDVDFVPSKDLEGLVRKAIQPNKTQQTEQNQTYRRALVVPAFEKKAPAECTDPEHREEWQTNCMYKKLNDDPTFLPRTFDELKECINYREKETDEKDGDSKCIVFQSENNWDGHSTTNSARWLNKDWYEDDEQNRFKSIPCFHTFRYEPYVVLEWCPIGGETTNIDEDFKTLGTPISPHYDERFYGYGKNKIEMISHLQHANYRFEILPEGFLVHQPHLESEHKEVWNENGQNLHNKMDHLYVDFLKELDQKYENVHNDTIKLCPRKTQEKKES